MTLLCLILLFKNATADIPYMPFLFSLKPEKPKYTEGEPIKFIISITNKDKEKTYPILLPDNQNTGKKLFYFNICDAAKNFYRPIELETREILNRMVHEGARFPQIVNLKAGEEVTFTAYLNNMILSGNTKTESHHWFSRPLLPGKYKIGGVYNPSNTFIGDTLFHIYDDLESHQDTKKINFSASGIIIEPCEIEIINNGKNTVTIDFWNENNELRKEKKGENIVIYFINDSIPLARYDFNSNGNVGSFAQFDYKYRKPWKWDLNIRYFENGNIAFINKRDDLAPCPQDYFVKTFYNDTLLKNSTEILPDSTVQVIEWNEFGQKTSMGIYSADRSLYNVYYYHPMNGKVKRKRKVLNPCIQNLEKL